jgi:cytochrome c oxidase assembly protein subunit 15
MPDKTPNTQAPILACHRNLLVAGAIFTTMLIAMGGILCVTQSIRNCPDWPGCFGQVLPPVEAGPVLEVTHRLLAGVSSLLIVSSAVVGMVRVPQLRWISIPPLVAIALLLEVSFFGAQVVLRGLSPGWATVDVASALLVVALMVTAAVKASRWRADPRASGWTKSDPAFGRFTLATAVVVYAVMGSGILVAGKGSFTGCLAWPIYNLQQFQLDGLSAGNILRLSMSVVGVSMLIAALVWAWRKRRENPAIYQSARWVGLAFLVEALLQVALQAFGQQTSLLIPYTIVAAALWALLVALLAQSSLQSDWG